MVHRYTVQGCNGVNNPIISNKYTLNENGELSAPLRYGRVEKVVENKDANQVRDNASKYSV